MNAAQKEYAITSINATVNIITVLAQCVALVVFQNYFVYLFIQYLKKMLSKYNWIISLPQPNLQKKRLLYYQSDERRHHLSYEKPLPPRYPPKHVYLLLAAFRH